MLAVLEVTLVSSAVILEVLALTLFVNTNSAARALVTSAVILEVLEVTLVSSAVILEVLALTLFVNTNSAA
jgi:hypothetical protein